MSEIIKDKTIWDELSRKYSAAAEAICDANFASMKTRKGCDWFQELIKNPEYNMIDYLGTDSKGRSCAIELKTRNMTINAYDSIMIEVDKFNAMKSTNRDKLIYINFLQTANFILICDLSQIEVKNMKFIKNCRITIKNLGKEYTYLEDRFLIPYKLCKYFVWDIYENRYIEDEKFNIARY